MATRYGVQYETSRLTKNCVVVETGDYAGEIVQTTRNGYRVCTWEMRKRGTSVIACTGTAEGVRESLDNLLYAIAHIDD